MRALLLALLAACPGPKAPDAGVGSASGSDRSPSRTEVPADAPEPSQEERLAAIQKAMNELDEAAQACWAVAAVERFDIEGEIRATIDIDAGSGPAKVAFALDTTNNKKLGSCLSAVLARYPWAPPLHGQAIQLPFKFRAPDGQSVIDRALVPWVGQGKIAVATLLDENNSGNGAASIVELAMQAGGQTGLRIPERAELWLFLGPATVEAGGTKRPVKANDMMFVPANVSARNVIADADVHAVVVMIPGGREGSARAGALPAKEVGAIKSPVGTPMMLPAATAKTFNLGARGNATIFAEPAITKDKGFAATILEMPGTAKVPEHVHAKETELLYVLAGSGTLTVGGTQIAVTPTSVVQIPPNTKHSFAASADFRALQIYTPAGPEQRFKAP